MTLKGLHLWEVELFDGEESKGDVLYILTPKKSEPLARILAKQVIDVRFKGRGIRRTEHMGTIDA